MVVQLNNRALLKLSGKDVQSFLQGQFSNDIDALEKKALCRSMLTVSIKVRLLRWFG